MKKASSSLLVFLFAVLFVTLEAYAQRSEMLSERVQQTLRSYERLSLAQVLRLHGPDARRMEVLSLTVIAQSFRGRGQLNITSQGRTVGSLMVKRQLNDATIILTPPVDLDSLEMTTTEDIFIESLTAEVQRGRLEHGRRGPGRHEEEPGSIAFERQPTSYSTLTLRGLQESRGHLNLDLMQMVRSQLGYTLSGAEVTGVLIDGGPLYGRSASAQVIVNGRSMGERQLPFGRSIIELGVSTREEIRELRLIIRGDGRAESIQIKIGSVRAPQPRIERVSVREEISANRSLELSRLIPYESRMVRSITLEARTRFSSAEVAVTNQWGEFLGSVIVSQSGRSVLTLHRPTTARDLRLQSFSAVTIEAIELEFDQFSRY